MENPDTPSVSPSASRSSDALAGLLQAQQVVDQWIQQYGVRYFDPLTNTVLLMEEVGELARLMARQYGEQSFKEGESADQIGPEMADVLWVLLCLANQCGINLDQELQKSLDRKSLRDAQRHLSNPKLRDNGGPDIP